jgi:hypothetical protein
MPPTKKVVVVQEEIAPKKYRLRGRECVSMAHFFDEVELAFDIPDEAWQRDLQSLRNALIYGGLIRFPSRITIYDGHYAAGELDEWPDILAVFLDQELVKRGCEMKVKQSEHDVTRSLFSDVKR